MTIRGKPSIADFLDGSATKEKTGRPSVPAKAEPTRQRITKTIRLAVDLEEQIKERAYRRTRESGQRITESDIIDDALRMYFSR